MATVTVIVRSVPFRTRRSAEALRMAVGQTLADNDVRLIFAEDCVYILQENNPSLIDGGDFQRSIETLRMLNRPMYAEAESLNERGVTPTVKGVTTISRAEVARMLAESDVVIPW